MTPVQLLVTAAAAKTAPEGRGNGLTELCWDLYPMITDQRFRCSVVLLVDLLSRYSNRQAQIEGMEDVLCRITQGDQTALAGSDHLYSRARTWRVEDRLSAEQLDQLVAMFTAGTPKTILAERFNISLSSVKRLLRRHGARRPAMGR